MKAATLGTVSAVLPIVVAHSSHAQSVPPPPEKLGASKPPDENVLAALEIAKADSLLDELFKLFATPDLAFEISQDFLTHSIVQDQQVGLVIRQAKTVNPRFGGDLVLTCDLKERRLLVAQRLIGASQSHMLMLRSITLDARDPLEEVYVSPRVRGDDYVPVLVRRRREHFWNFVYEDAAPLDPREFTEVGWPPELPDVPRWHYSGCADLTWTPRAGGRAGIEGFAANQVVVALPNKPDSSHAFDLNYIFVLDSATEPSKDALTSNLP